VQHREPVAKNAYLCDVEKPEDFTFRSNQAVELAVDQPGWSVDEHPYTNTSLPDKRMPGLQIWTPKKSSVEEKHRTRYVF